MLLLGVRAPATLAQLPAFVPNRGQDETAVLFRAQSGPQSLFVTATEVVSVVHRAETADIRRLQWNDAGSAIESAGEERQPGAVNFLRGGDAGLWQTDLPRFAQVRLHGVYPGVEVIVRLAPNGIVVRFEVQPGAEAARVKIRQQPTRMEAPRIWQEADDGQTQSVEGRWVETEAGSFRLDVGAHDPAKTLFVE